MMMTPTTPLARVPPVEEVIRDPRLLNGLPLPALVDLRRHVGHLQADLDAAIQGRLLDTQGNGWVGRGGEASDPKERDRLLTVKEVAQRLGHSVDWVYRHADRLPFTVKVSRRVYFSERGYERFIQQQQGRR